jgi:hypothetical protein
MCSTKSGWLGIHFCRCVLPKNCSNSGQSCRVRSTSVRRAETKAAFGQLVILVLMTSALLETELLDRLLNGQNRPKYVRRDRAGEDKRTGRMHVDFCPEAVGRHKTRDANDCLLSWRNLSECNQMHTSLKECERTSEVRPGYSVAPWRPRGPASLSLPCRLSATAWVRRLVRWSEPAALPMPRRPSTARHPTTRCL